MTAVLGCQRLASKSMLLLLSGRDPANSTYATETGQILYKVTKPLKSIFATATIQKAVGTVQGVWLGDEGAFEYPDPGTASTAGTSHEVPMFAEGNDDSEGLDNLAAQPAFEGHFAFIAQVEINVVKPSLFRYNGLQVPARDYLRFDGLNCLVSLFHSGHECSKHAMDTNIAGSPATDIALSNDGSEKQVAKYEDLRADLGPFRKRRQGSLEVDPSCEPILDEIMMTFIYLPITMHLFLSGRNPANSSYAAETGQVLYKVTTPLKVGPGTTTIRKAVGTVQGVWQGETGALELLKGVREEFEGEEAARELDDGESVSPTGAPILEGHFAFFAQIEFHAFADSRFRYNSLDVPVSTYFRKEGWSWLGRVRVFRASDGLEYRWERRIGGSFKLFNNESDIQVGKYDDSRPDLGPLLKGRQGSLEVDPSCEPILDEIILTFVYTYVNEEL
ncbi:hypothetical protein NP233_g12055 [Leucocoprinus birnbaumii]|uniref:DUF6593 domain-containing protein n=1 Tax=Leucocoprinus birnbaumii TaxID=56174 RepID=A0AAD5YKS4_9AGAR|nr:hypothetical protein NP233_g12055 [Leucocoprinus birnbaumii]